METRVVRTPESVDARAEYAISTDRLTKSYGRSVVVDGLSLHVPQKSIFGFLGPNGAGKTTTIKMLLGLANPTSGRAEILGLDAVNDSLSVRGRIGYLAQDPLFYRHMTARETLAFTCRFFFSGSDRSLRHRIDETLELVGLGDKGDRQIRGFSGGERQRLGIAQAQVHHPDLLILDEPAAALDPLGRRDVLEIMERLKDHATIFFSTHILDDVQRVSDHVAILDRGKLVANAPTADLLRGDGVVFEITVRGEGTAATQALKKRSWVDGIDAERRDGTTTLTVGVLDEGAADAELLSTVIDDGAAVVTHYGRKHTNLEDVFLGLVERQDR